MLKLYCSESISGRQPQAHFYKRDGKCFVSVYMSWKAPQNNKSPYETRMANRYNKVLRGLVYEVTPESGNAFYKRLLNEGWLPNP